MALNDVNTEIPCLFHFKGRKRNDVALLSLFLFADFVVVPEFYSPWCLSSLSLLK